MHTRLAVAEQQKTPSFWCMCERSQLSSLYAYILCVGLSVHNLYSSTKTTSCPRIAMCPAVALVLLKSITTSLILFTYKPLHKNIHCTSPPEHQSHFQLLYNCQSISVTFYYFCYHISVKSTLKETTPFSTFL